MSWFPIGPDFVFSPRNPSFRRLSRRNEWGAQALVLSLSLDSTDPDTIYVAAVPSTGGHSAFRTRNGGASWVPIADMLQQSYPQVDPGCFAVNPAHPEIVYMGTLADKGTYVSMNQGDSWGPRVAMPGSVFKLIVDPRTAANPATTVLYAATSGGLCRSADGGATWNTVLGGAVWSLAVYMPVAGPDHFYAGISDAGVFHATDPTGVWTNLNTSNIGLPAQVGSNFSGVLVDFCPRNPNRVYALLANYGKSVGLYTTSSPLANWSMVAANALPDPYGSYCFALSVAPNSPGDGVNDILFFARVGLFRSIDSGRNWDDIKLDLHTDYHNFAFFPNDPQFWSDPNNAKVIPALYVGCDGGIGMSTGLADPGFLLAVPPSYFNEDEGLADSAVTQNLNHGLAAIAGVFSGYASDPSISALSYANCQDTGLSAGNGALGWRGLFIADGGPVAVSPGTDGVDVWADFLGYTVQKVIDKGEFGFPSQGVTLDGVGIRPMSNLVIDVLKDCIGGVHVFDEKTVLTNAIAATGVQVAAPKSMVGIVAGDSLSIEDSNDPEQVLVTATTATTFTAAFAKTHPAGVPVQPLRQFVVRMPHGSLAARQISQNFGAASPVTIAASPVNSDIVYVAPSDQRLWTTTNASKATNSTVWTEVVGNKPGGITISSLAFDAAGSLYVLLSTAVTTGGGEFLTESPLFLIQGGMWLHQACTHFPTQHVLGFTYLRGDALSPDTLYASHDARVYRLKAAGGSWDWQDISDGLPGQWIYDLWTGNIGTKQSLKILIRAFIPTRGVWERDVTHDAKDAPVALYVRKNVLDQGWLDTVPNGAPNPYDPSNPGAAVFHYQSADIKIDAQRQSKSGGPDFFQTDPEGGTLPITHVLFDQLQDNSENLPQTDAALVHVQVRNRSHIPANNVRVWAIYCKAAAGVPGLKISASQNNAFAFWKQFGVNGQVVPQLPADSPWKAIGSPVTLSGIDAANPQVASWNWVLPKLPSGDPGHYCIAVFVHSAASPLNDTSFSVDELASRNRQVGQKNVHVGPPLPPRPPPPQGGGGGGAGTQSPPTRMLEYVEFHNPTGSARDATLTVDLRGLPPQIEVSFQCSPLNTVNVLASSLTGVANQRPGSVEDIDRSLIRWIAHFFEWLGCWLINLGRWLGGLPMQACRWKPERRYAGFVGMVYTASPSAPVSVTGVRIPAFGHCAMLLSVQNRGVLPEGSRYQFQVQQKIGAQVVGGSTYIVRVAGQKKLPPASPQSEVEAPRYVPAWAKDLVEARERLLGKRL